MAFSQFGGRSGSTGSTGSGSGGAFREIGEMVQVPTSFTNSAFVDVGTSVTNSSHPELFKRLQDSSLPASFSTVGVTGPVTPGAAVEDPTAVLVCCATVESELIQVHHTGVVTATQDGSSSIFRGVIPAVDGISPAAWLPSDLSYPNCMAYKNGRLLLLGVGHALAPAAWISDDRGATWTVVTPPVIRSRSYAGDAFNIFGGLCVTANHFVFVNWKSGTLMRSADGIVWDELETPIPADVLNSTGAVYGDPESDMVIITSQTERQMFRSVNGGTNWTTWDLPTGIVTNHSNIVKFNDALFMLGYSSTTATHIKSVDNGESWTVMSTNSTSGSPRYLGVFGDKLWAFPSSGTSVGTTTNGSLLVNSTGNSYVSSNSSQGSWTGVRSLVYHGNRMLVFYVDGSKRPSWLTGAANNITSSNGASSTTSGYRIDLGQIGFALSTPNRMFVFAGGNTTAYRYTEDGQTWIDASFPTPGIVSGGHWDANNNLVYVTRRVGGAVVSSDLGETWSEIIVAGSNGKSATATACLHPIIFGGANGQLFATHQLNGAPIIFAPTVNADGTRMIVSGFSGVSGVAFPQYTNPFTAVSYSTGIITKSANGIIVWPSVEMDSSVNIQLTFSPQVLGSNSVVAVAVGASKFAFCTNPLEATATASWTESTLPVSNNWNLVINLADGRFVILSTGSRVGLIGNGISWTDFQLSIPFSDHAAGCVFKDDVYLFSGMSNQVAKASPATVKIVPSVPNPVAGAKYVVKATA